MRGILTILIVSLLLTNVAEAQYKNKKKSMEFGISFGSTSFLGDLGGSKDIGRPFINDIDLQTTRPFVGVIYRNNFNHHLGVRMNLLLAQVGGDDQYGGAIGPNDGPGWHRSYRNLSFKSHIIELSAIFEVNLLPYAPGSMKNRFTPYVFAGAGMFHFDPKGNIDGNWVRLQPLGTEGQGLSVFPTREKYSLVEWTFPIGAGVKYNVNRRMSASFEVGHRFTTTDYIDDVSTSYVDNQYFYDEYGDVKGQLVASFADRSSGEYASKTSHGAQRGDPSDYDSYTMVGVLTLVHVIRMGGTKYFCPKGF